MYKTFIAGVTSSVLKSLKDDIEKAWLASIEQQIAAEIELSLDEQAKTHANQFAIKPPLPDDKLTPDDSVEFHGQRIAQANLTQWNKKLKELTRRQRSHIEAQRKDLFSQTLWKNSKQDGLCQLFDKQLSALNLKAIIETFFNRHAWLLPEITKDGTIHYSSHSIGSMLLEAICKQGLITWLDQKFAPDSTWQSIYTARGGTIEGLMALHWQKTHDWDTYVLEKIEAFPYDDLGFYQSSRPRLLNIENEVMLNHRLSRLDVLRLIKNHMSDYTPRPRPVFPLILGEVGQFISNRSLSKNNTFLINIANEAMPEWVALDCRDGLWTAYINHQQQLRSLIDGLVALPFQHKLVRYDGNQAVNDIDGIDPINQWHAVLFGRVLPQLQQRVFKDDYLSHVPLSLLFEYVVMGCFTSEYFNQVKSQLQRAFSHRQPFSNLVLMHVYKKGSSCNYLFDPKYDKEETFYSTTSSSAADLSDQFYTYRPSAAEMIRKFEQGDFSFASPRQFKATIKSIQTYNSYQKPGNHGKALIEAWHAIYHAPDVERVEFEVEALAHFDYYSVFIQKLIDSDVKVKTVVISSSNNNSGNCYQSLESATVALKRNVLTRIKHCAARNRFLSESLTIAPDDVETRKAVWTITGQQLVAFFLEHANDIQLDFVNKTHEFNQQWAVRPTPFDHEYRGDLTPTQWRFVQVAQMGSAGLDALFTQLSDAYAVRWNRQTKEPAPKCPLTLDIANVHPDSQSDYLTHLATKISGFQTECAPLFNPLSLLLPAKMTPECEATLLALMTTLNDRINANPDECQELVLHHLDVTASSSQPLITKLLSLAKKPGWQLVIRLPNWNRDAFAHQPSRTLKASYRELQNLTRNNQRRQRQVVLAANTKHITSCAAGRLDPQVVLDDRAALKMQPWDGEDVEYTLGSDISGIQQGQQQQQEQQQNQSQQQQQEQQQEQAEQAEQALDAYGGIERLLVTRDTMTTRYRDAWNQLTGNNELDIAYLFSQWVGSDTDAPHVIQKIEPAAIEKMMHHAAKFRMGIAKDNLPAGFRIKQQSRGTPNLILCFNRELELYDIQERAKLTLDERNSFTVELIDPTAPTVFTGDYRQFASFNDNASVQQTLWHYLAQEEVDPLHIQTVIQRLSPSASDPIRPEHAAVISQRYDVTNQNVLLAPVVEQCLDNLHAWAIKQGAPEELADALFKTDSPNALTLDNLKAFGQLFNQYDALGESIQGTSRWLLMASQIWTTFGPDYFAIWKKRVLNPSKHWGDCLEKTESDAVALSVVTLKGKPGYQAVWWALVEAHGNASGAMRYSELWSAYQQLVSFLQKRHLELDPGIVEQLLRGTPDFNAQIFLDRLYFVLKKAQKSPDANEIQQTILNQLHVIDWRHNGFYYACRYEDFPYWDYRLRLTQFESNPASYIPQWDVTLAKDNPIQVALRFASQRLQRRPHELERFSQILAAVVKSEPYLPNLSTSLMVRLLTACMTTGVDTIEHFQTDQLSKSPISDYTLNWLNGQLRLDGALNANWFQLHYQDIAVLSQAIDDKNLDDQLSRLDAQSALDFINACGRALHCYRSSLGNQSIDFEFMTHALQNKNDPFITDYPWLFSDRGRPDILLRANVSSSSYPRECLLFQKQLRSIAFEHTSHLPNYDFLDGAYQRIANEGESARLAIVAELIKQGCMITYQEAPYRKLTTDEQLGVQQSFERLLRPHFKHEHVALFNRLLGYFVIPSAGLQQQEQLDALIQLLARFDNKDYYNELSQIIGLLIDNASTKKGHRYYSVKQLTTWLQCLMIDENKLYPINLLNELLLSATLDPNTSTLLNQDLYQLTDHVPVQSLQDRVREIASNEDLPNQYKPDLIKLAIQRPNDSFFVKKAIRTLSRLAQQVSDEYLSAASRLFVKFAEHCSRDQYIDNLTQVDTGLSPPLAALWKQTQLSIMNLMLDDKLTESTFNCYFLNAVPYVKMILIRAFESGDNRQTIDEDLVRGICAKLTDWSSDQLEALACYCGTEPHPCADVLLKLLTIQPSLNAAGLIHYFETVIQASDKQGVSKRYYSTTDVDHHDLLRVLPGFKRKGQGPIQDDEQKQLLNLLYYANGFAAHLANVTADDLTAQLHAALAVSKSSLVSDSDKLQASAQVLACMREIVLRKTGKWANHTQMLDLLYAAIHNDESLLHQVRTGEGKSIITLMRASYLALSGKVVDLFSSKTSLSKRDHDEFCHVLEAFGIRHSYILPDSSAEDYHDNVDSHGVGAVNYATIGNFSLAQSKQFWETRSEIDFKAANRVAFLDEADHILNDEQTQFNFSDSNGNDTSFNLDEWVYRVTYDFYLRHIDTFKKENDAIIIKRNQDLRGLCQHLLASAKYSPQASTFIKTFIFPAISGNSADVARRDNQLKQLLTAAHVAHSLKEGKHYSVRPAIKIIGGMVVKTRFAKVMINSQIIHGSTYSDLVQQFLHVKLNKEASNKREAPNFFVEPYRRIALSQNVRYLLTHNYKKIEGCTGTAGNRDVELKTYQNVYGIQPVIKLPTHKETNTRFLAPNYCSGIDAQVAAIVDQILNHQDRPILITCKDDIAVKALYALVIAQLSARIDPRRLIQDTNDSGKSEDEVLHGDALNNIPAAGMPGTVVFSARMGRGTDIKPESMDGLMVLRTYPTTPRSAKQEIGRQGRNAAHGTCQDIINWAEVEKDQRFYSSGEHAQLFNAIIAEQTKHLTLKINKHQRLTLPKAIWTAMHGDQDMFKKYVITRSIEELKHRLKEKQDYFTRKKEYLLASLSAYITDALQKSDLLVSERSALCEAWLACRSDIETFWSVRLVGGRKDDQETYTQFYMQSANCWSLFAAQFPHVHLPLHTKLDLAMAESTVDKEVRAAVEASDHTDMSKPLAFYQRWVKQAEEHYFGEQPIEKEITDVIYGADLQGFNHLFKALSAASRQTDLVKRGEWFDYLATLITDNPRCFYVTCDTWAEMIDDPNDHEKYKGVLTHFFNLSWVQDTIPSLHDATVADIKKISLLLKLVIKVVKTHYTDGASAAFIVKLTQVIHDDYWEQFDEQMSSHLESIFASDDKVTKLLTLTTNEADLRRFLVLLFQNITSDNGQRVDDLKTYLGEHVTELQGSPSVIKPLFELTLGKTINTVPLKPKCLPQSTSEQQGAFWHFLKQRQPVRQNESELLLNMIALQPHSKAFSEQILQPLFKLPPYVTLSYLNKHLKPDAPGKFHFHDSEKLLASVHRAGQAWCDFMLSHGLIESAFEYKNSSAVIDEWQGYFNQLIPDQNAVFFKEAMAFPGLSLETLASIVKHCINQQKLDASALRRHFALASAIERLLPSTKQSYLYEQWQTLLTTNDEQALLTLKRFVEFTATTDLDDETFELVYAWFNLDPSHASLAKILSIYSTINALIIEKDSLIKRDRLKQHFRALLAQRETDGLDRFIEFLHTPHVVDLERIDFDRFLNDWDGDVTRQLIKENLSVRALLEKLALHHDLTDINDAYEEEPLDDAEKNTHYLDFLSVVTQDRVTVLNLPNEAILCLWTAWQNKKINNKQALHAAIDVAADAIALQQGKTHWHHVFADIDQNRLKRQKLMQYLAHDLLNLGPKFADRCYHEYQALAVSTAEIPHSLRGFTANQRHAVLREHYQPLIMLSREIAFIAKHPVDDAMNEEGAAVDIGDIQQEHQAYFAEQQVRYASFWWTNVTRRTQAATLFNRLGAIADKNKVTYYQTVIDEIMQVQQTIINEDRDATYALNQKGYSRLYDICTQMCITVIRDCLADNDLKPVDKAFLHKKLHEQMVFHIDALRERLPNGHRLKKYMNQLQKDVDALVAIDEHYSSWEPGSTEFAKLSQQLDGLSDDDLPSDLNYLRDNLNHFMLLADDPQPLPELAF